MGDREIVFLEGNNPPSVGVLHANPPGMLPVTFIGETTWRLLVKLLVNEC